MESDDDDTGGGLSSTTIILIVVVVIFFLILIIFGFVYFFRSNGNNTTPTGTVGPQGPQGLPGEQGLPGPPGPGSNLNSITYTYEVVTPVGGVGNVEITLNLGLGQIFSVNYLTSMSYPLSLSNGRPTVFPESTIDSANEIAYTTRSVNGILVVDFYRAPSNTLVILTVTIFYELVGLSGSLNNTSVDYTPQNIVYPTSGSINRQTRVSNSPANRSSYGKNRRR